MNHPAASCGVSKPNSLSGTAASSEELNLLRLKMSKWNEIINEIQKHKQESLDTNGEIVWFRGQSDETWRLESTLHRYINKYYNLSTSTTVETDKKVELLRKQFTNLYHMYHERAWHLLSDQERKEWGIIFSMRHHGIPSLLLDWTESFATALFFANIDRKPTEEAAIFILNPKKLNKKNIDQEKLISLEEGLRPNNTIPLDDYHPCVVKKEYPGFELKSVAVTPVLTNRRMIVQHTKFVICGDSFTSLEKGYSDCIKKIILPIETYDDSQKFLDLYGINNFSVFPDLEGLRKYFDNHLKHQIELNKKINKKL